MKLRIVSTGELREMLTYPACIEVVRAAMKEVSRRNVHMPLRHAMPLPNGNNHLGMMYGYLGEPESFGIKLASLFPDNPAAGFSSHLGLVVLYEAKNGSPVAIMDGGVLTAIRTAAASAVATEKLARTNSRTLAILGCGEEAETHLRAIPEVRDIRTIRVWGRNKGRVEEFVKAHGFAIAADVEVADSVEQAVEGTDIVCTVTAAPEPILFGRAIERGMHINLVGSSFPDKREVDTELVVRSRYFIDYRESTLAQAGEFLRAKEEGAVDEGHIVAEIGEVLTGENPGRQSDEEITVYKSLGVIAQDLAAATYVWRQAEARDQGTVVEI